MEQQSGNLRQKIIRAESMKDFEETGIIKVSDKLDKLINQFISESRKV
ncbi:Spo0E family sporulation regulatory protein-aspartic acid phosphatase [Desulfosporosinus sp. SB140]